MIRRLLLLLALAIVATPVRADFNAKVVGVSDGDTITVVDANRRQIKIRLHGIDAPEKGQPWSDVAKRFLSEGVFGKTVLVRDRDQDRYGRTIAVIYYQIPKGKEIDVNASVVEAGLAWAYVRYSKDYAGQELSARREGLGLWRDPRPVPPWEWRKLQREKK